MKFTYDNLPIDGKEDLKNGIQELFGRDISEVPCGFSSRNYAFIFADGCFPVVIRVGKETEHKKVEDVLSELMWLDDLRVDVPNVCQAMPSLGNRLVERITIGEKTYLVSMFRKANGNVTRSNQWDPAFFYRTGALLGKIHRASSEGAQRGFRYKRKAWDESPYVDFSNIRPYFSEEVQKNAEYVLDKIKNIPKDPRWYGMIHGDFNYYNLFYDWDTLWAFDFDDACYGYFMFDIATLIHMFVSSSAGYFERFPDKTFHEIIYGENGMYTHIRKGYSEQWELPEEQWDLFDDFFRLRVATALSMQCATLVLPVNITIALNEPYSEYLKYDQPPMEKVLTVIKAIDNGITPESRNFLEKMLRS